MENKRKRYNQRNNSVPEFLQKNPEYHLIYMRLLKEARTWNGSGQYWLGSECSRRASCLLRGDVDGYKTETQSEDLFFPTKKFHY